MLAHGMVPPRRVAEVMWSLHRQLYRRSGGRVGERMGSLRTLLLTTTGRKSGQPRSTPLIYLEDGENVAVVASNLGSERPPAWWLNLQARPEAEARFGRKVRRVRGREATPEEHERLWPRFVKAYSDYEEYTRRTSRKIPIVILEPLP